MNATRATEISTGRSNCGDDTGWALPRPLGHGQAGMRLIDYLQLVIAQLQSGHSFSEDQAAKLTFNLATVLCISDAHWEGYTPEATACAVVQLHSPHCLS